MMEQSEPTLPVEPQPPAEPAKPAAPPQTPPIPQVTVDMGKNRTPLWILSSVVIGFLLPICACAILTFSFFGAAAMADPSVAAGGNLDMGVGPAVAVVRVEGTITNADGDSFAGTGIASSGMVINDLREAAENTDVKAIVLRVDSPGGTVTGSAQIYEELLKIDKPIVVSMAGLAASGGYYVSAPADYIFARPDTFTGSIGVISQVFQADELLDEVGVDVVLITSGDNKALGSLFTEMTAEQKEIFQDIVDEAYEDFVSIIAEGRKNLSVAEVRALADGRIYTGRQALENGLVDELGNYDAAIAKAAELGGISGEPRVIEYENVPSFEDFLLGFSASITQTEAEKALAAMNEFTLPVLEYRYIGQ